MSLDGKRILLVEDEMLIAMMAEEMLSGMGAAVVGPCASVPEALALAAKADFDLALLDFNLNGARADPVIALLRQRGVPLVLATGYGAMDNGVPDDLPVIEKPYTEEALRRLLEIAAAGASP
jgi:CheY-like chemotaxis protein